MQISSGTDVGRVRANNEDAFDAGFMPDGTAWAVVCDGMGGHEGGEVASAIAVETIVKAIKSGYETDMGLKRARNMLVYGFEQANDLILEKSAADERLSGMGCTVVAAVMTGSDAVIAHVGDSRAYGVTDGVMVQITRDHSYVQQLVDAGLITHADARIHPQRNMITRALGVGRDLMADIDVFPMAQDSKLLLCTDGLSGLVDDAYLCERLDAPFAPDLADKLIETANERGGTDNITAVVIAR